MVPYRRTPTSEEEVAYWTNVPPNTGNSGSPSPNTGGTAGAQVLPANGSRAVPVMEENEELFSEIKSSLGSGKQIPGAAGQGGFAGGPQPSDTANRDGGIGGSGSQKMGMNPKSAMDRMTPISGQESDGIAQENPPKSAFEPSSNHFIGTMRGLLARNLGQYVVATFLVGPQSIMTWEGFLHSVGEDYLVLYQPSRRRYASAELNGLKFIEFYEPNNIIPGYGETYR